MSKVSVVKMNAVKKELIDLDVQPGSEAWEHIYEQCFHAQDILTVKELKQLINDHLENFRFEQRGF